MYLVYTEGGNYFADRSDNQLIELTDTLTLDQAVDAALLNVQ